MYETFYGLSSDPFRLLPDPEVCFPHRSCSRAWAYLRYALKRGEGIVVVTGPPGSGKTTLAERLLDELNPAQTVSVRLIADDLNPTDLLRKLAYSFGLPAEGMDRAMLAHRIERYLIELEHGNRQALVLIDEAQTLSHQSLEAMRLLTDLQSRSRPVLQLFLLGQEGLEGVMCAPGMVQFQQRVIASCRLEMMDLAETRAYMEYRLAFADWQGDPSINGPAVMAVYHFSEGLPRHVNKICSRLLLHGCTEERHSLTQRDVLTVVQDLREELLAPFDEEAELATDTEGTDFGSVAELALAPALTPQAEEKRGSREELHVLFLAEEQRPDIDAGEDSKRPTQADDGRRRRRGAERYAYRVGYPRPDRPRRWAYRLFQTPGMLGSRAGEWAREWGLRVGGFLLRVGRRSVAIAARAGGLIRNWFSEGGLSVGNLRAEAQSVSAVTMAGLGGLLVVGVALVFWSRSGGPQQSVADAQMKHLGHSALPIPAVGPAMIGSLVLDGPSPQYLGVDELPVGAKDDVPNGLGDAEIAPWVAAELDLLGQRYGMDVESGHRLLGSLTASATEVLIRGAANSVTTLNIWSVTSQVSEATDGRLAVPKTAAEEHANDGQDAVGHAAAKAMNSSENNGAGKDTTGADAADGQIAVNDREETPETVVQSSNDMAVVAVVDAPVPGQVSEIEMSFDQSEVARLLALAEAAMERDWLLRPKKDSAYVYLQAVLAIDPQNGEALSGLERIVRRYAQMARWALGQGSLDRAERYVARGLWVDPDNAEILRLRNDVGNAIAEMEAAKMAATQPVPVPARAEVVEPEPIVPPESNFDRLMSLVEGEN